MESDADRRAGSDRIMAIHDAFRRGDLEGLRRAVGDPEVVPNGQMPLAIGPCLVYAIYHSPLPFIRTLLELGADPNVDDHTGFPPLIAALSCARPRPGSAARADVGAIVELLLNFGANPNQRGVNDYTPLHMAVAERNADAVHLLLDRGADPELRTRIDDHQTPREMADRANLTALVRIFDDHAANGARPDDSADL
jgi:ankyrin repeat protein